MRAQVRIQCLSVGALAVLGLVACSGGGGENQSSGAFAATISWSVPLLNTDGSPLTDVTGYRVYYGTSSTTLANSMLVTGGGATSTSINGLEQGTYYFAVTTLNSAGLESNRSDVVSRTFPQ